MPRKPAIHTAPAPSGGWLNEREGGTRPFGTFKTKAEAQAAGRARAIREKTEHVIHTKDGRIGQRNSYGNDPRRSRG